MALTITEIITLRNATVGAKIDLDDRIELAKLDVKECTYGDNYNQAVALRVLHNCEIDARNGSGGSITSEKEGQLSRGFGATVSSGALGDTSWGRELEQLTKGLHFFPRTRMMPGCPTT